MHKHSNSSMPHPAAKPTPAIDGREPMQITVVARPETNEVAILTTMATAHIGLQPQDALEIGRAHV